MPLFSNDSGVWQVNEEELEHDEEELIASFIALAKKNRFNALETSCGVPVSPDFGYLHMADRFWRASMGIYMLGVTDHFEGRGIGYSEPWLFNARHAFELYIKGFVLYARWLIDVQSDFSDGGYRSEIKSLYAFFKREINHTIDKLYYEYRDLIADLSQKWNYEKFKEAPAFDKMLISQSALNIIDEIGQIDRSSFRFRYPSIEVLPEKIQKLQGWDWKSDPSKVLPESGLPQESGYSFDHIKVINSLHMLRRECVRVGKYLDANWDYIGNEQELEREKEGEH